MIIRFDGKIVVVTGAGHGFGREISRTFARLGALVFATDLVGGWSGGDRVGRRDHGTGAGSARPGRGGGLDRADRNPDRAGDRHPGEQRRRRGRARSPVPLEDVSDQDWNTIFDINVNAAFTLCRAAAPGMKRAGGGRIVNISSGAGLQPSLTGIQAYCSAKHAVVGLTRQLAHELGRSTSR